MRAGQDSGPGPPKDQPDGPSASAQERAQTSLDKLVEAFKALQVTISCLRMDLNPEQCLLEE